MPHSFRNLQVNNVGSKNVQIILEKREYTALDFMPSELIKGKKHNLNTVFLFSIENEVLYNTKTKLKHKY